jgi:predicted flap endonuclease-1-like 5' DNA nuclease
VRARKRKRIAAVAAAVALSAAVLYGMELMTVDSRKPQLHDFAELPAEQLEAHDFDMFKLAKATPAHVASLTGASPEAASKWIDVAKLATLRGLGSANVHNLRAIGINSMQALAAADWRVVDAQLEHRTGRDVVDARVRVWIRGARRTLTNS